MVLRTMGSHTIRIGDVPKLVQFVLSQADISQQVWAWVKQGNSRKMTGTYVTFGQDNAKMDFDKEVFLIKTGETFAPSNYQGD